MADGYYSSSSKWFRKLSWWSPHDISSTSRYWLDRSVHSPKGEMHSGGQGIYAFAIPHYNYSPPADLPWSPWEETHGAREGILLLPKLDLCLTTHVSLTFANSLGGSVRVNKFELWMQFADRHTHFCFDFFEELCKSKIFGKVLI